MTVKADLWFPTVIWNDELKQINNSELKEYVIKLKAQDEQGKVASNYGGWQSKSFDILDERPITVERFIQSIQNSINECTKMAGLMDLQISDYWWNITSWVFCQTYWTPQNLKLIFKLT